jgi:hypothetical protein
MKTNSIFLVAFALLSLSIIVGCRAEDPDDPTVTPETGFILVGESGTNRVIVDDNHGLGWRVNGEPGYEHYYQHVLDSASGAYISLGASYSTSSGSAYMSSGLNGSVGTIEFAMVTVTDSIMTCYELSPDSMSGSVTTFNTASPRPCGGQLYYDSEVEHNKPLVYFTGARIDENLPWQSGNVTMFSLANWMVDGGGSSPSYYNHRYYYFWPEDWEPHTIAFRLREGNRWRYGYADLTASSSTLQVHRFVVER